MKKAYIFPGQGAQFPGMAKDLYNSVPKAAEMFEKANEIPVSYTHLTLPTTPYV